MDNEYVNLHVITSPRKYGSIFVYKARVGRFCNQLIKNRIIWRLIEPDIIGCRIIE